MTTKILKINRCYSCRNWIERGVRDICSLENKIIPNADTIPSWCPLEGKGENTLKLDIDNIYKYHAPNNTQTEKYETLRNKGKNLAKAFEGNCPDSREKSLAMTKLEEAIMWANAAIARNE